MNAGPKPYCVRARCFRLHGRIMRCARIARRTSAIAREEGELRRKDGLYAVVRADRPFGPYGARAARPARAVCYSAYCARNSGRNYACPISRARAKLALARKRSALEEGLLAKKESQFKAMSRRTDEDWRLLRKKGIIVANKEGIYGKSGSDVQLSRHNQDF